MKMQTVLWRIHVWDFTINKCMEDTQRRIKQAKLWLKLARILPLTALSVFIVPYVIGWDSTTDKIVCVIIISFLVICFLWWFWAVDKILMLLNIYQRSEDLAEKVNKEINVLKKIIKSFNK